MKKKIKVRSAKAKGARFQNWTALQIANAIGLTAGPEDDVASRPASCAGTDIMLSNRARYKFPWSVECKAQEKVNLWDSIKQAKSNVHYNTEWLLTIKRNRERPIVVIDAEIFYKMWELILCKQKK